MAGLSPIGGDWKTIRDALTTERSGVQRMPEWDEIDGLETRLGAPVRDFSVPDHYGRKQTRAMGRLSLLAT
jgi:3-oxoacyl-[acyl-carrier-protein] synthase II